MVANNTESGKAEVRTKAIVDEDQFDEEDDSLQEDQYLTFIIASETFGINILNIKEIIRIIKITSIPETLSFIKGVINLRGKIIPVMDVRIRFDLEERPFDDRTCIIVVHIKDLEMGLIVDRVAEVLEIPAKNVEPMPSMTTAVHHRFVKGFGKINDEVKILLDLDRLLFDEEIEHIKKI